MGTNRHCTRQPFLGHLVSVRPRNNKIQFPPPLKRRRGGRTTVDDSNVACPFPSLPSPSSRRKLVHFEGFIQPQKYSPTDNMRYLAGFRLKFNLTPSILLLQPPPRLTASRCAKCRTALIAPMDPEKYRTLISLFPGNSYFPLFSHAFYGSIGAISAVRHFAFRISHISHLLISISAT